ncbi:unnamed protein product, partial [Meganyctiphanes norvegica]
ETIDDALEQCNYLAEAIPEYSLKIFSIAYRGFFPVIILFGIILNGLCIVVVSRRKIRLNPFSMYVKFGALVDVISFLIMIPIIKSHLCSPDSYSMAFYKTYLGWTLVSYLRHLSYFSLLWISYDRFLAIWFNQKFKETQNSTVVHRRLVATTLFALVIFLPGIVIGEVKCAAGLTDGTVYTEAQWLSIPGYKRRIDQLWFKMYRMTIALSMEGIPSLIQLALSIGLIVGLIRKGRNIKSAGKRRRKSKLYVQTAVILCLNATYILVSVPHTILTAISFSGNKCHASPRKEVWLMSLNVLTTMWYCVNVTSYAMLRDYRRELFHTINNILLFCNCISKNTESKRMTLSELSTSNN